MVKGGGKARTAPAPAACSPAIANCGTDKCLKFGSTQVCTECDAGNVPINGNCAAVDDTTKAACKKDASTELEDSATKCGNCGNGFVLFQGGCYEAKAGSPVCTATDATDTFKCTTCGDGLFPNAAATATTDACSLCDSTCKTCSTSATHCDSCDEGYYFDSNTCTACTDTNCKTCSSSACSECKSGYYLDSTDKSCKACSSGCKTCTASSCSVCLDGFVIASSACLSCSTAPGGVGNCQTCTTKDGGVQCTACGNDALTVKRGTEIIGCLQHDGVQDCEKYAAFGTKVVCSQCKTGKYPVDEACTESAAPCTEKSGGACTKCADTHFLFKGGCYTTATYSDQCSSASGGLCTKPGDGLYLNGTSLLSCLEDGGLQGVVTCALLGGRAVATKCGTNDVPINGRCEKATGYAGVCTASSGVCSGCKGGFMPASGGCYSPRNSDAFGLCADGKTFLIGESLVCSECPTGSVPINGTCTALPSSRLGESNCVPNGGRTACSGCNDSNGKYFLLNGGCYSTDDTLGQKVCTTADNNGGCTTPTSNSGFYKDGSKGLVPCSNGCNDCGTDGKTCTGGCVFGHYSDSNSCKDCSTVIDNCVGCTGATVCTLCANGQAPTGTPSVCAPDSVSGSSSSSSGLSGGAIAGIVIAVLLVLGGLGGFLGWWFGCRGK
ncbi:pVSP [Giardia muris]|uniref:PVSP n=1 Tax=Giardia muris TaxID=5742 RepID=A0A4Z1T2T1_GIAMU|nr:pVSP [Giardia muris]|eukprot:TNJ27367.1 pVSP [Giardia muris]